MGKGDDEPVPWLLSNFMQRCIESGKSPFDGDPMPEYELAGLFFAPEFGFLWPRCPRRYLVFCSTAAQLEALRIITLVRAADDPILAPQYVGPMSTREVNLYRLAKNFDAKQHVEAHRFDAPQTYDFTPDHDSELSVEEQLEQFMRVHDAAERRRYYGRR